MTRGRKPKPTALKKAEGNPGKRALNHAEPEPPEGLPSCPEHLSEAAREEWARVAGTLHGMGVLSIVDRAGLAAYCQAYGRWVEAERRLAEGPQLVRTPSGHVQQSPWMGVANKQLEIMGRYMAEFGMTPASRSRVAVDPRMDLGPTVVEVQLVAAERATPRERGIGDRDGPRVEIDEDDAKL